MKNPFKQRDKYLHFFAGVIIFIIATVIFSVFENLQEILNLKAEEAGC